MLACLLLRKVGVEFFFSCIVEVTLQEIILTSRPCRYVLRKSDGNQGAFEIDQR